MIRGMMKIPASIVRELGASAGVVLGDVAEEYAYRMIEGSLRDGMVFRTVRKMEERTGLSEKAQATAISALKEHGYLSTKVLQRNNVWTRYFILSEEVKVWAVSVYGAGRSVPEDAEDSDLQNGGTLPPKEGVSVPPKRSELSLQKGGRTDTPITESPTTEKRSSAKRSKPDPFRWLRGEEEHPLLSDPEIFRLWGVWLSGSQGARNTTKEWRIGILNELQKLGKAVAVDNIRYAGDNRRPGIMTKQYSNGATNGTARRRNAPVDLGRVKSLSDERTQAVEELRRKQTGVSSGGMAEPPTEPSQLGEGHRSGHANFCVDPDEVTW